MVQWFAKVACTIRIQSKTHHPCIVTRKDIQNLCYVDDIANKADSKDILDKHIQQLEKVYGKLTAHYGPTVHFLGAKFHLPGDGTCHCDIKHYLSKKISIISIIV